MKQSAKSVYPQKPVSSGDFAAQQAERTLRLLARVAPPAGLEERIHSRLWQQMAGQSSARTAFWPSWRLPVLRPGLRPGYGVAAAALLCVVAGAAYYGGRDALHRGTPPRSASASPAVTGQSGNTVSFPLLTPPQVAPRGNFGSANSMRVPPTLKPLYVPEAPHRKPTTKTPRKPAPKHPSSAAAVPDNSTQP